MSWLWREIFKLGKIGDIGCNMKVINGMHTKFWTDRWCSHSALTSIYSQLFECCTVPYITVFEVVMSQGHALQFNRQLTDLMFVDFNALCGCIHNTQLTTGCDQVVWR
jgi:hypothetical protein